jgi:ABC-type sugar transport system permease subunit
VILVSVWFGAPFLMIMYLASLKSVAVELYEGLRSTAPPGFSASGT